jgi:hypothetical protein
MTETSRRTFFKGAAAVTVGATAGLPSAAAQTTSAATDHEAFIRLSLTLTGLTEKELPAMIEQRDIEGARVKLYEIYYERLRAAYPAEFAELLAAWRGVQDKPDAEAALSEILARASSAKLRTAARQVIKIWYLSTMDDPRTALDTKKGGRSDAQIGGDLGQFQHSVIWKLIGAPPTGYSNGTHGYWANKPAIAAPT